MHKRRNKIHLIRFNLLSILVILFCLCAGGCNGSGGSTDEWDFIDHLVQVIPLHKTALPWESWVISAPLEGDDKEDYSFIAKLIINRDGNKITGFGSAHGYPLGSFILTGTRTGDNIVFEIRGQNRYRAFTLEGKGIYMNSDSKVGGNSLEGSDYITAFDDPVTYTGNFQVDVKQLSQPLSDWAFGGHLDGSYNSIEDGEIVFHTSSDGTKLTIESIKGSLVGSSQSAGPFIYDDATVFTEVEIISNRFSFTGAFQNDIVNVEGEVAYDITSGFVVIQLADGDVHIGTFSN